MRCRETRGCHEPSRMRAANSAPPSGTLYTAPRPAPAAQASRISRSRGVNAPIVVQREMPRSPRAAENCRGAPSRPSEAPDPTTSTCSAASSVRVNRGNARFGLMTSVSAGTSVRRRSNHQPQPASAPPAIGPTMRRTGLLADTPSSSVPNE